MKSKICYNYFQRCAAVPTYQVRTDRRRLATANGFIIPCDIPGTRFT